MRRTLIVLSATLAITSAVRAQYNRGALILNEYNAVSSANLLDPPGDSFEGRDLGKFFDMTADADPPGTTRQTAIDTSFKAGRFKGNGGNWLELVVTQDKLDIRGWTLNWSNDDEASPPGPPPGNHGFVLFSNNSIWSSLRAGTIITVVEDANPLVTFEDNSTHGNLDLASDVSFNPNGNDWWINVEMSDTSPYVTTPEPSPGVPNGFKTDNDNWLLTIRNQFGHDVFGPVGESASNLPGDPDDGWGGSGINSREVGVLSADPSQNSAGTDFNDRDYSTFGAPNLLDPTNLATSFDELVPQDFSDLRNWFYRTDRIPGDADLDRFVGIEDIYILASHFNTSGNLWTDGDFNGDGIVNATDLSLLAGNWQGSFLPGEPLFSDALAQAFASVPEPASLSALLLPGLLLRRRGRRG